MRQDPVWPSDAGERFSCYSTITNHSHTPVVCYAGTVSRDLISVLFVLFFRFRQRLESRVLLQALAERQVRQPRQRRLERRDVQGRDESRLLLFDGRRLGTSLSTVSVSVFGIVQTALSGIRLHDRRPRWLIYTVPYISTLLHRLIIRV